MKILAAGKTSSERAALSVARELGLEIGGQCRKGTESLQSWLRSEYCKRHQISEKTVAEVIKRFIKNQIKLR